MPKNCGMDRNTTVLIDSLLGQHRTKQMSLQEAFMLHLFRYLFSFIVHGV